MKRTPNWRLVAWALGCLLLISLVLNIAFSLIFYIATT